MRYGRESAPRTATGTRGLAPGGLHWDSAPLRLQRWELLPDVDREIRWMGSLERTWYRAFVWKVALLPAKPLRARRVRVAKGQRGGSWFCNELPATLGLPRPEGEGHRSAP